jgi:hypothetical protein
MTEEWCPFAVRRPGPAWKVGYSFCGEQGKKRGEVKHSAEGHWGGIHAGLDGPALKSWQFTVGYDRMEQHYPFRAHCWHAGDVDDDGAVAANVDLVGVEHLGFAGELLTDYQIDATAKLTIWLMEQEGHRDIALYPIQGGLWTLAEHGEVSDTWTACPSGRIPRRIITEKVREYMALEDEVRELKAWVLAFKSSQDYQNEALKSHENRLQFLQQVAVNHDRRLVELEPEGKRIT